MEVALAAAVVVESLLPLRVFQLRMDAPDVMLLVAIVLSGLAIIRGAHALLAERLRRIGDWAPRALGIVAVALVAAGGLWHGPPHYALVAASTMAVAFVLGIDLLAGPGRARWRRLAAGAVCAGLLLFIVLLVDLNLLSLFPRHVSLLGTLLAVAWLAGTLAIAPPLPAPIARQAVILGGLAASLGLVLTPGGSARVAGYLRRQSDLGSLLAPVAWAHSLRPSSYLVWGDDSCPNIPQQPVQVTGQPTDRNLLFISIDTLRRDLYLAPGQTLASAYPNLASVAREGCRYDSVRSVGASTHMAMPALYNGTLAWTTLERPLLSSIADRTKAYARVYGGLWQITNYTGLPNGSGDPQRDSVTSRMISDLDRAAASGRPFMFIAHYLDLHLPRKAELLAQFSGDLRPVYATKLATLDRQLGQLFTTLKQRGQWDNTIVVVTADHGEELNERGYSEHAFHLYDSVLAVPLIARMPGKTCLDSDTPLTVLDVLPMVAGGLGMTVQSPAITGAWPPVAHGPFFAFSTVGGPFLTVIEDNQKIIVDGRYSETEIYDLNVDPLERHDLGGELTPAIAERLRNIPLPWNPLVPLAQRFRHRHGTQYDVCPGKIDPQPREATAQSTVAPRHSPHAFRVQ